MMDPLLAAALVGTAQHPGTVPRTGTPIDTLIDDMPATSRERALLLAAGATALYQAAGMIPATHPAPERCPADTTPLCSPRAAQLLDRLLSGRHGDLLPEALRLLQRAGRRLPAQLLPRALEVKAPEARAALLPVLGARGRWLARHNSAWGWVAELDLRASTDLPEHAETIWEEGTQAQRLAIFRVVREVDPERARAWLAAVWKQETADLRLILLDELVRNLSADDEPFLEAALDDKSERVRHLAGSLLACITAAAFSVRMRDRAAALLTYRPARLPGKGGNLSITVPAIADALWRRDTNNQTLSSDATHSYRPSYIRHTLALIRPAYWCERFNVLPTDILAAAEKSEDAEQVIDGLTRAALLHRDVTWADALWPWWLRLADRAGAGQQKHNREMLRAFLSLLPPAEAEARLQPLFRRGALLQSDPWSTLIAGLPAPWGAAFSVACLDGLRDFVQASTFDQYSFWLQNLDVIARSIAPSSLSRALAIADPPANPTDATPMDWRMRQRDDALTRFVATIRFRQHLYQVLGS